ncbi:hypothetical protein TWF696_000274 [Orbilia brochopaga]|uniref:Uncharacterized protein n=1 Tax=Orbilia brochopaga TaxID=3140254 RepID=A0AAV9VEE1_9PEZI
MALARNYAISFFDREWRVSGLWNEALHDATTRNVAAAVGPPIIWQISSEAFADQDQTQANRADLLISKLGTNPAGFWGVVNNPVLCFEAKKGPAPANANSTQWRDVRKQIETWCDQSSGVDQGNPCWAVGAIGNFVKFWIYTTSIVGVANQNQKSRMVPVTWDATANGGAGAPRLMWTAPDWRTANNMDQYAALNYNDPVVPHILDWMLRHKWAEGGIPHPSVAAGAAGHVHQQAF